MASVKYDDQLFLFQEFVDTLVLLVGIRILVLDDPQVVIQGLHVGIEFGLDISGQVPDVLVGQRHHRTCHEYLPVVLAAFQSRHRSAENRRGWHRAQNLVFANLSRVF